LPSNRELTIVLPAYREAESLRQLLPKLKDAVTGLTSAYEILVVDAQTSIDETEGVCRSADVRHIFRRGGNRYGDAVRTGIASSTGDYVLLMDADGSHNPAEISSLWQQRRKADLIIGSRYTKGGRTQNPAILIFLSFVVNVVYRLAFGLRVHDVTNSFRLYRGDQVRALHLDSLDFEVVEEILIRLAFGPAKATVIEVPVTFEKRKAGESKRNLAEFAASYIRSIVRLRRFRARAQAEAKGESN
jgi:dolichol-phosphate mannosyltransferase